MNTEKEIFENSNVYEQALNLRISRENAFNFIRLVCCLLVIIFHSAKYNETLSFFNNGKIGHLCVCVFFILSGFWVTQSYLRSHSLKDYFLKRIKKLLPMYYIAVFSVAIFSVFISELSVSEYFKSSDLIKYIFWNSIFLNFVHPGLPGVVGGKPINGALWTIKVEIGFYIVLPLIIFFIKRIVSKHEGRKWINIFFLCIYFLSVTYNFLLSKYAVALHLPQQLSYQLPGFMSFFISGMIFLFNWDYFLRHKNLVFIVSIPFFVLSFFTKTEILMPFTLSVIVIFIGISAGKLLKSVGNPVDYSYGMYLFHFPLIKVMVYFNFFESNPIFSVFCVIALSFMITFMLEKYLMAKIK